MNNIPEVKIGIAAVSRDCFPMSLSERRRKELAAAYRPKYGDIYECPTVIENELHMKKALSELKEAGCNALVVYLGNFVCGGGGGAWRQSFGRQRRRLLRYA